MVPLSLSGTKLDMGDKPPTVSTISPWAPQFPQGAPHNRLKQNGRTPVCFGFFFLEGFCLVNFAEICLMISTLQCLGKCL